MFEQAQIQEFKEVSAPPHSTLPCRSWSWPLSLLLPSPNTLSSTPSLGWGLLPPRTVASTHRPSAALTRIVMASSASQTFGRPTPSWVSTHLPPSPTRSPRGPAERGQASSLPPLPTPLSPCWLSQVPRFTLPPPTPPTQLPLPLCPWLGRSGGSLGLAGDTPGPHVHLTLTRPQGR